MALHYSLCCIITMYGSRVLCVVTTELVSPRACTYLSRMNRRGHGVCRMSTVRKNEENTHGDEKKSRTASPQIAGCRNWELGTGLGMHDPRTSPDRSYNSGEKLQDGKNEDKVASSVEKIDSP